MLKTENAYGFEYYDYEPAEGKTREWEAGVLARMKTAYEWVITHDFLEQREAMIAHGPSGASSLMGDVVIHSKSLKFRLYDDDDELYYEGFILFNPKKIHQVQGLEPLDDFGMPNAGCTSMRVYYPPTNKWVLI